MTAVDVTTTLRVTGAYDFGLSVAQAAAAAFVSRVEDADSRGQPPVLDLAFPLEGGWQPVAVRVDRAAEALRLQVTANPGDAAPDDVQDTVLRVLALDVDGGPFAELATRDPVVERLQRRFPGLRPISSASPYECAARAIVQHQLSGPQAVRVTDTIAHDHGMALEVDGRVLHTFPAPAALAELPPVPGLARRKVDHLRRLGERAAEGRLPTAHQLRAMDHDEAMGALQESPGIGPFSAELVLVRGAGHPDVFPLTEPSLHRAMTAAYGLDEDVDVTVLRRVAERWRPYRSWVGLLLRRTREEVRRGSATARVRTPQRTRDDEGRG